MVVKYSQIRPIANEWVICKNLQIIHDAEKKCTGMKGRPSKIEYKTDIPKHKLTYTNGLAVTMWQN